MKDGVQYYEYGTRTGTRPGGNKDARSIFAARIGYLGRMVCTFALYY